MIRIQRNLFATVLCFAVLPPFAADAADSKPACDVSGAWNIVQDNGPVVNVKVSQDGSQISGSANSGGAGGVLAGRATGRQIGFRITWKDNTKGVYFGVIGSGNAVQGTTFEYDKPGNIDSWNVGDKIFSGCP